jgi:hypothetical protein
LHAENRFDSNVLTPSLQNKNLPAQTELLQNLRNEMREVCPSTAQPEADVRPQPLD